MFIPPHERDTVGARLIELFSMPKRVVPLPVGDTALRLELQLLNDKQQQEVYEVAGKSVYYAQTVVVRRETLARAILSIDGHALQLPDSIRAAFEAETGRPPRMEEERSLVLSQCQPLLLQEMFELYLSLLQEQQKQISELKKRYIEQQAESPPEMPFSSEPSQGSAPSSSGDSQSSS